MLICSQKFATAIACELRTAQKALKTCASGKPWRGHHLHVVQMPGNRGGKSGVTWGLDVARATPELLEDFPGLKAYLDTGLVPAETQKGPEIDPRLLRVQTERFDVIKPAIDTVEGTSERVQTLRDISANAKPCWGSSKPPSLSTLGRWLKAYEERGLAGLLPDAPSSKGERPVLVSRKWDQNIDLAEDEQTAVAKKLETYTLSLITKSMSATKARGLATKRLVEMSLEAGSSLSKGDLKAICEVSQKYTDRLDAYRRMARHDLDNKLFFDGDRPRISRGRCEWPMEVVWGDVHPIDIYMKSPDGKEQRRLRLISWMDDCTRYMWATVAVLGKGQGIRQTDIADSLFGMVCDPVGGVPRTLYLDNGGEYLALGNAMLEIPGAVAALSELGGVVKAKPYNGPAKGLLEHSFSTLEQGYFKHIQGWIGGDRTNKKTQSVGAPVKGFEGTVEDLINAVLNMVSAYNNAPQGGQLGGASPRAALEDAIARGWQSVSMDVDAFDFAFSRRDERSISQGKFTFDNQHWVSDATCLLGKGDKVGLRIPLRSGAEGIFVIHDSIDPKIRAFPETLYHPLDRNGARESARRNRLQEAAIRQLKKAVDPTIDPATEILKGVNQAPVAGDHMAIIRLGDSAPKDPQLDRIESQRAQMIEFAEYFGWSGYSDERRTEGT